MHVQMLYRKDLSIEERVKLHGYKEWFGVKINILYPAPLDSNSLAFCFQFISSVYLDFHVLTELSRYLNISTTFAPYTNFS